MTMLAVSCYVTAAAHMFITHVYISTYELRKKSEVSGRKK